MADKNVSYKNIIIAFLMLVTVLVPFSLNGCGRKVEEVEIVVFAAASLTEPLIEIADEYERENKNVKFVFNFDSSGTLETQIKEGAHCDIFLSAAQKQMDALEQADMIVAESRKDLLENHVVLVCAKEKSAEISSFQELFDHIEGQKLAIGNEDVPVGQYTRNLFAYYQFDEEKAAKSGNISYGSNVREITTQVNEGIVDFGIVYRTDALACDLQILDSASEEICGRVVYPVALMRDASHYTEAEAFWRYLSEDAAKSIFEKAGFMLAD